MKLKVIIFGKLKTTAFQALQEHYLKLLSRFIEVELRELKTSQLSSESSQAARRLAQGKEEKQLLKELGNKTHSKAHPKALAGAKRIILLDERGAAKSSAEWAGLWQKLEQEGVRECIFCIGSSQGFSEELREKANTVLGLGPQTLSHALARIVFFEQMYRTQTILNGHPYHIED